MSDVPFLPDKKQLRIWQQNVAKSKHMTHALLNGNDPLHEQWDLICIQEPHLDFLGIPRVSNKWRLVYPKKNVESRTRSIILVNARLDTNSWHDYDTIDSGDVSAICLKLNNTTITVI